MIEVSLLGRVAVTVDGVALSGEAAQRRRVALLALLCIPRPQPIQRDRLMLYLWPDSDTESARHVLSVAVHVLRKSLGHDALLTTADEIGLTPEHLRVDVHAFEDALKAGDSEAAVAAYGGPFMDGFRAGAGVELEQWVDGERARLQRLFAQALEGVAGKRRAAGDLAGAAEAWHRRAALDPYSSQGALGLMRALAEVGDRAAAIRHAGIHKQLLEAELGAGPDPEVEALAEELRREPPPHVVPVHAPGAGTADGGTAGRRDGAAMPAGAGAAGSSGGTRATPVGAGVAASAAGIQATAGAAGVAAGADDVGTAGVPATAGAAGVGGPGAPADATSIAPSRSSAVPPSGFEGVAAGISPVGAQAERTPVRGSTRAPAEGSLGRAPLPLGARWRGVGRRRWGIVATGVVLLALAGFVAERWQASRRAVAPGPHKLAVLPFTVLGHEEGMEYLGDGIAEQILNALEGLPGLQVVARGSSFRFRGTDVDVRAVGDSLGVDLVLSGTVEPSGDKVRVAVELDNARNGFRVWRQSYDAPRMNARALEDGIATGTALALHGTLEPRRRRLPDPRAHDLYLRGIYAWYQRTPQSLLMAVDTFARAVEIDDRYAEAWAGLAQALTVAGSYDYGALPPDSAYPAAEKAARRALALDDSLGAAHAALAGVYLNYYWDFSGAEREFERAVAVEPHLSSAHQWYGLLLLARHRQADAWEQMELAAEGDASQPTMFVQRADYFYYTGQYDKAVAELQRALQIDSTFALAHLMLALTQIQAGRAAETAAALEKLRVQAPEPVFIALLGSAYGRSGQMAKARAARRELAEMARGRYVPRELFALVDVALGDKAAALTDLEQAFRLRSNGMVYLDIEPAIASLRDEPRFTQLQRAVARAASS